MNKGTLWIAGLVLLGLPWTGMAQETGSKDAGRWYLRLGGTLDVPAQDWNGAYKLGGGVGTALGYRLDGHFALQLEALNFNYSGTNAGIAVSDMDLRILPTARYTFGDQDIRPYLTAGAGLALQFATAAGVSQSYTNPVLVLGAGESFRLGSDSDLFLQVQYGLILTSDVTGQDVPIQAGVEFGL